MVCRTTFLSEYVSVYLVVHFNGCLYEFQISCCVTLALSGFWGYFIEKVTHGFAVSVFVSQEDIFGGGMLSSVNDCLQHGRRPTRNETLSGFLDLVTVYFSIIFSLTLKAFFFSKFAAV